MADENDPVRQVDEPLDLVSSPVPAPKAGEGSISIGAVEVPDSAQENAAVPHAEETLHAVDASASRSTSGVDPLSPEAGNTPEQPVKQDTRDRSTAVLIESRKHTRRSFAVAAVGIAAGYGIYRWLDRGAEDMMQPILLRRTMQANAAISRTLFDERALTPTYPVSRSETLRINGIYGLKQALVPESWRLQLVGMRDEQQNHPRFSKDVTAWEYRYSESKTAEDKGHDTKVAPGADTGQKMPPKLTPAQKEERTAPRPRGQEEAGQSDSTLDPGTSGLLLTMDDILKLPRHELVTQFKCIEGWSQVVHWAGVRMVDFLAAYPPGLIDGKEPRYVYMETPDGDYYTGYDMDVCRHPQTLLVTEMMGEKLTQYHGAPLRLHMPTKYGYKQIKCIGLISYTNDKPDDYWTKLGYDWYAGL